ncbi:MAG: site-specific integrase [Candidatus Latescibacteria bacterium]|nr:site-specific integrase [Candidatus Latescibacterota bacterium]
MTSTDRLPHLLQDFFRLHLVARRNLSPHTVRAYRDALVLLLRFAATRSRRDVARLELTHLGEPTVLAFLEDLEAVRGNGIRTRNARLAAIHSFFRYVAAEEPAAAALCRGVLGIPVKRAPQPALTCLSREEVTHLLAAADGTRPSGRRDAALLWFLYNTGARAQEVVDLRLPALRLDAPAQVRLYGKGRKERLCPLWTETVGRLRAMLRDRTTAEAADQPLFVNATGRPLTRFGLRYIIRQCALAATHSCPPLATKPISPHTFRHTTALHLLQSGVELNVVRCWLGHASIETTHGYVEVDLDMKRAALAATAPPENGLHLPAWRQPGLLAWLEAL